MYSSESETILIKISELLFIVYFSGGSKLNKQKGHFKHHCGDPLRKQYFIKYNENTKRSDTFFCQDWMWCEKCIHPVKINQSDPATEETS